MMLPSKMITSCYPEHSLPVILPTPDIAYLMSQYERAKIQTLPVEMKTQGLHACLETISTLKQVTKVLGEQPPMLFQRLNAK